MIDQLNRRAFGIAATGIALAGSSGKFCRLELDPSRQDEQDEETEKKQEGPVEAPFERDYEPPSFKPKWRQPQVNRSLAQDFVIYAHSDLKMVQKLLAREPGLLNASIDWGAGDWETGLGGASHMGRKDIVEFLLSQGARSDIFCAAMMGMLEVVQALISLEPKLIDAKGPHGFFNLHVHAQAGGKEAEPVLDYLQSIKKVELRPLPFLKKKKEKND